MPIYAIVPAAGISARFSQKTTPKQYCPLLGKPVLEWTLSRLLAIEDIVEIRVVLAPKDDRFSQLNITSNPKIHTVTGGKTRYESVYRGFQALGPDLADQDWILVHDAARPSLHIEDLNRLIDTLKDHAIGGILAEPVRDTLKKVNKEHQILRTIEREKLWQAQTPQLFRVDWFRQAMNHCQETGYEPTDESAAIERIGLFPAVVEAYYPNPKITVDRDLIIAEALCRIE